MELVFRIDTTQPPSAAILRSYSAYLLHIADNHAEFFAAAPGNAASIFGGQQVTMAPPVVDVVAPPPPPPPGSDPVFAAPPPAPPAPTNNGDGSATDLLRGADLDADGIPWDARIHSTAKSKNADGRWKLLRGVNKELVPQVIAELKGTPATTTPPPPPAAAPIAPPPPPGAAAVAPPPPPPAPPAAAAAPATPPPPPAPAGTDEAAQQTAIINGINSGKITVADLTTACIMLNVGNMMEAKNAGKLGDLYASLADKLA